MSALYFDGRLLVQEDPSPRVNVRQFTKLVQNHKSKMVHLEGSTRNNSPDSGKNQRARRSISKGRRATIHQIWAKSQEQEDPSPRIDMQQFTRFGQNHKSLCQFYSLMVDFWSKKIHLKGPCTTTVHLRDDISVW
eukprot:scaffold1061_cov191-Cylindrotheca_fusiformis.AAC.1